MEIKTNHFINLLPHIQPLCATFFLTFRLHGSLPKSFITEIKEKQEAKINALKTLKPPNFIEQIRIEQKRYFQLYDKALEQVNDGPTWLSQAKIAKVVVKQLEKYDGQWYDLLAYCIMSNHVHILIDTRIQLSTSPEEYEVSLKNYKQVDKIMQRIKGASARYSNLLLNRTGTTFWHRDYYARNLKEINRIIAYILNNPVKAGIVNNWQDYAFNYLKPSSE